MDALKLQILQRYKALNPGEAGDKDKGKNMANQALNLGKFAEEMSNDEEESDGGSSDASID